MGWMDWHWVERNRAALERILAMLVALAGLADRAALLPAPLGLPVLAVLGRAEAVARSFLTGVACEEEAPIHAGAAASLAPFHAARLAASLRALALVLGAVLAQSRCLARSLPGVAGPRPGSPVPPLKPAGAFPAVAAPDTS